MLKGADVFIDTFEILIKASEIFIKGVYAFNRESDILSEVIEVFNKGLYLSAKGFERIGKAKILAKLINLISISVHKYKIQKNFGAWYNAIRLLDT